MTTIHEVKSDQLIEKLAQELKKIPDLKQPSWAIFVKTGMHRERPPLRKDWWHIRAAAVLRKIALLGPIGVNKLRTKYGGRKRRGHKPEHFYKSSGNILRKVMQGLEKAGLIKKVEKGVHKGKIITAKGNSLLINVVSQITGKPIARTPKRKVGPIDKKSKKTKKKAASKKRTTTKSKAKKEEELKLKKRPETKEAKAGEKKSKEPKLEEKQTSETKSQKSKSLKNLKNSEDLGKNSQISENLETLKESSTEE